MSILSQGIEIILWYIISDNFNALNNFLSVKNTFLFRMNRWANNQLQAYGMHTSLLLILCL